MRVTDKMGFNQVINNIQKNRAEMNELQNQTATQKRITKPSDDPVSSARVLAYRTEERGGQQFLKNINVARSFLDYTDVSLQEVSDVLMRLKELAIQQASDAGASPETRRTVAEEVGQTFSQLIQVGNRKLGDRYIFGGFNTTQSPFDHEGNYFGDDGDIKLHINKDAFVAMNIPGDKAFLGAGIGADGIVRASERTPKTTEELEQYQLDERERIRLNQEGKENSVRLRGPANLDDRGQQAFKSNINGDSEGINILQTVKNFEVALRVNDKEEIQDAIDNIDKAIAQIVHTRAQVGARLQVINHGDSSLRQSIVDTKATASQMEDADLFQVASDMTKADSTLKATLETSAKITQPSLLDFLK